MAIRELNPAAPRPLSSCAWCSEPLVSCPRGLILSAGGVSPGSARCCQALISWRRDLALTAGGVHFFHFNHTVEVPREKNSSYPPISWIRNAGQVGKKLLINICGDSQILRDIVTIIVRPRRAGLISSF